MRWDKSKEQENKEKTKDFQAKMAQGYDFKKAYAARRAWEFYNHPDVDGRCYVAVGGLDSITLFLFLRSIGINVPGTSVSMLEDRSIQQIHKALGIKNLKPAKNPQGRPYGKIEVVREFGFPVLSKETAGKINTLQHPTEKNATVRHAIMTGETGEYGGFRKSTRMKMSQKWLEKFGGPENEREGTNYQTAPFPVSDLCCYYLKEKPCDDYAKESGRFPYMGLMASEGGRRQKALMLNGCNYISKDTKRSRSLMVFHTDAVQAVGHIPVDVQKMGVDMLSLSAHKFGGPRGVGALYCRSGVTLEPFLFGGGQERGRRPGTENTAAIVAMAVAMREACENMTTAAEYTRRLRDKLVDRILEIPGAHINGSMDNRLPGNINCRFDGVEGEAVVIMLDLAGVCVSAGSACTSGSGEPSHVLTAMGQTRRDAYGAIRITLAETNTETEVEHIADRMTAIVKDLRRK